METKNTIQTDTKCCSMKSMKGYCPKPLEAATDYLSKKWAISIIVTIGNFKSLRFNELLKRLETTAKTLSTRLKELEKVGIIKRNYHNEIPPKVVYSLTNNGLKLLKSLHPLIHWAEKQ